ncbi:hypothetical protein BC940DRAFT_85688 [Gongronella butleri]|nr:hypothetical protein BC940DRAFT_85688 [Gongronella butleri]
MKFSLIAVATVAMAAVTMAAPHDHRCLKSVHATAGTDVAKIAQEHAISVHKLLHLNHGLELGNLLQDTKVCVAGSKTHPKKGGNSGVSTKAPSNAVRHIVPNCNKYATVLPSDADCTSFSAKHGIKESQLYQWNKGLHHAGAHLCDNLDTGKAYCVGVKN